MAAMHFNVRWIFDVAFSVNGAKIAHGIIFRGSIFFFSILVDSTQHSALSTSWLHRALRSKKRHPIERSLPLASDCHCVCTQRHSFIASMSRKNENGATITRDAKGLAKGGGEDPGSFYYDTKQNDDDSVDEQRDGNEDEDDDDYRFRVYGTTGFEKEPFRQSSVRKFSRRLSRQISRRRSSLVEAMPETPAGWSVLLSALGLTALGYEINLQKSLTKPPITIGQIPDGTEMASIFAKMTATPESILSRTISPSLFVGTRGQVSSIAAYLLGGPKDSEEHLRFREIVRSSQDGAQFAVDWEVPWRTADSSKPTIPADKQKAGILKGPIRQPVIIVLHGINNDSSFGYMKSLLRSFASRGWNAAGMNFRGCGGVPLTTPRAYNASYTGDLRNFVHQISARMDKDVPVFLVGNSLGANVMTKYLGEEGLSGTLPPCVAGGARYVQNKTTGG